MTQNRRKPLDALETTGLVPVETEEENGSYAFVNLKRAKKPSATVAVIVDASLVPEEFTDVPTRNIRPLRSRGTPPFGTIQTAIEQLLRENEHEATVDETAPTGEFTLASLDSVVEPPVPETEPMAPVTSRARHDPDLCTCPKMMTALSAQIIMVVCDGPVTLSPAILREDTLLKGDFNLDRIEQAYDGKLWAFRYCPFEGCLIDDQVEILQQVDNMTCCGTMAMAVEHGRVELSDTDRPDRHFGKFTEHGGANVLFSHCPWCKTDMFDLVIARYKRVRGH